MFPHKERGMYDDSMSPYGNNAYTHTQSRRNSPLRSHTISQFQNNQTFTHRYTSRSRSQSLTHSPSDDRRIQGQRLKRDRSSHTRREEDSFAHTRQHTYAHTNTRNRSVSPHDHRDRKRRMGGTYANTGDAHTYSHTQTTGTYTSTQQLNPQPPTHYGSEPNPMTRLKMDNTEQEDALLFNSVKVTGEEKKDQHQESTSSPPMRKVHVSKQGVPSCCMYAKFIRGDPTIAPEFQADVNQRAEIERIVTHLKKISKVVCVAAQSS